MQSSVDEKLKWLIDRAAISDLLFSFARALDTKDYAAYANNYADGGYIELPDPMAPGSTFMLRKEQMLDLVPKTLGRYTATHHISANHQIEVDRDAANSRSYLQAVHVSGQQTDHWSAGGWYDCDYVRTPLGWKFTRVRMTPVWLAGQVREMKPEV